MQTLLNQLNKENLSPEGKVALEKLTKAIVVLSSLVHFRTAKQQGKFIKFKEPQGAWLGRDIDRFPEAAN